MADSKQRSRRSSAPAVHEPRTTVLLVDDHDVVRSGLRALLEIQGLAVVGDAATVTEAVRLTVGLHPDVVLMDVRLAGESGIEATREILSRVPGTRVLMLTSFADDEAMVAAMLAGACGYVLKEVRGGDIVRAVRAVAAGHDLFEGSVSEAVLERVRKGKHMLGDKLAMLSPQEERVLTRIALGETNAEIGRDLDLAEKTVKNYVSNILLKLEVGRRAEAAAYFARHTAPTG